jgi:hypothetical protein
MFLGWASKQRSTVCEWFDLKTTRTVFAGSTSKPVVTISSCLASKPAATVFSGLTSKPVAMIFSSLASKLVATFSPGLASKLALGFLVIWDSKQAASIWWFGTQNHHYGFLVWASKPSSLRFVGYTIKPTEGCRHGTHFEI